MQSQISQVAPGHKSPPIFTGSGREGSERSSDTSREPDDFQSILDEPAARSDYAQSKLKEPHSAESAINPDKTAADGQEPASSETSEPRKAEVGGIESQPEPAPDTEETVEADAIIPEQTLENTGQPPGDAAQDAPNPPERPASQIPPWFAAIHNPGDATHPTRPGQKIAADATSTVPSAQDALGQERAGGEALRNPRSTQPATEDIPSPSRSDKELPIIATGRNNAPDQPRETPGAQVKSAMTGAAHEGNAKLVALTNAPGQRDKAIPEATHLTERQVIQDQVPPAMTTTRGRQPATPAATATAPMITPQMQNAVDPQDKMTDAGKVHWVSEAGFAADKAATETPATSRLQQATLLQQPELPRNIAVQMAQAMRQAGTERTMELTLNPAELGRVRISMQGGDGAMTVHVLAERPDTLDLMRRHIDILAQEFHEIGYGQANFAFGQNEANSDGSPDGNSDSDSRSAQTAGNEMAEDSPANIAPRLTLHSDRVDIRL